MIPAAQDMIPWFVESAGLPYIEELAEGSVRLNQAAQDLGAAGTFETIEQAIEACLGVDPADPTLSDVIASVRSGTIGSGVVRSPTSGNWVVLGAPRAGGQIGVSLVPTTQVVSGRLKKRASAVDLAAGVSHEVSNALTAITGWAEAGIADPAQAAQALDHISTSARVALRATRRLLENGRRPTVPGEHDADHKVADVLADVGRLLAPLAANAEVRLTESASDNAVVHGTGADLFTIVWNLAKNAIEALPPGGICRMSGHVSGEFVQIVVEDDGPGIPRAVQKNIFEDYFTTKTQGTGLGLALVGTAINAMGGTIELESKPGLTRFVVRIPAVIRSITAMTAEAKRPDPRVSTTQVVHGPRATTVDTHAIGQLAEAEARVLVVDDDEPLRSLIATSLELRGHSVVSVGSAAAVDALREQFDFAILDVSLGDGRGDRVLARLRARQAVHVAALASGDEMPADLAEGGRPHAWLRKPFHPGGLSRLIEYLESLISEQQRGTG